MREAGTQPPDGPPICTALMRRPSAAPPPIFSTMSRNVVPIGTSISPPRRIFPARAKTLVPLLLAVPNAANFSAPCRTIQGARASVSTLLISVGLPHRPDSAGKGGRRRGNPRRPSTDEIRAVSSPQTNAPAPSTTLSRSGKSAPSKRAPSQPRFSISAMAARTRRTASGYSWRM